MIGSLHFVGVRYVKEFFEDCKLHKGNQIGLQLDSTDSTRHSI